MIQKSCWTDTPSTFTSNGYKNTVPVFSQYRSSTSPILSSPLTHHHPWLTRSTRHLSRIRRPPFSWALIVSTAQHRTRMYYPVHTTTEIHQRSRHTYPLARPSSPSAEASQQSTLISFDGRCHSRIIMRQRPDLLLNFGIIEGWTQNVQFPVLADISRSISLYPHRFQ